MQFKPLTKKVNIPVLGLGTWKIGGEREADFSKDKESIDAIQQAIKMGYTHIDTAEIYSGGHTEELVGKAIQPFNRKDLFITTKVYKTNLRYKDLLAAAEKSFKRLNTKYIDLYLIHSYNPNIPLEETMDAMARLVDEKKVRFIGVSNFSVEQLKKARKYSWHPIVANQIEYNLIARNNGTSSVNTLNMESEIIPYCQKNDITIIAYRPLARGDSALHQHPLILQLAQKYNKTPAQIALNWLIAKQNIITITKSTNPNHLKENLGAMGWELSSEDSKLLDGLQKGENENK
ncbi:aldo/keto reductase [Candidatus Woesearchaeota archaeon]|nr:aldo/keto reductase [Candidatus Woesearchaeota archaeon]